MTGQSRFSPDLPLVAVSQLKSIVPAGRIYNDVASSGPLILAGFPDWQVNIDGRLYLYDKADWDAYNLAGAGQISLEQLVQAHRPAAFFLRSHIHPRLIELLRLSPAWRKAYDDTSTVIFVPTR